MTDETVNKNSELLSASHGELAHALRGMFIAQVAHENAAMPKVIAALRAFDALLMQPSDATKETFSAELQKIDDSNERSCFTSHAARIGQINEMAGLVARDNFFLECQSKNIPVPGGVEALIKNKDIKSVKQALNILASPTFAMTFTGHPTNIVSLKAIRAQRDLLRAIDAKRTNKDGAEAKLAQAMEVFVSEPVLNLDDKGNPKALTVADETDMMLNFVRNLYYDLPHIYDRFDAPLQDKFKSRYQALNLKLNIPLASWGSSGDKDGNSNVTSETTLQAIAQHKLEMLELYDGSLEKIQSPALDAIRKEVIAAKESMQQVMQEIKSAYQQQPFMSPTIFDDLSGKLQKASQKVSAKEIEDALVSVYKNEGKGSDVAKNSLDLIRRVRTFGMNGAKLEYRETAEEYTRILGALIDGYKDSDEAQRQLLLNHYLNSSEARQELAQKLQRLMTHNPGKYSKDKAEPITYHTMKRLELARDFPDMVHDHVLAECQGTSNFLELLLLQKLTHKDGKEARLGIVPLFEEHRTLEDAPAIVQQALLNKSYQAHVRELKSERGYEEPTQQVQLAHSDNARRAGMPAARAYIYEAHQKLRDMAAANGITLQFYEGGSQSDPYRGGVRAMSATMNEFGLHQFAKFTFQGGDLLNFLNYPSSAIRLFTRNISHCAEALDPVMKYSKGTSSGLHAKADEAFDNQAIAALKQTRIDYENSVFNNPSFNKFMEIVGYNEEAAASANGSRATARGDQPQMVGDKPKEVDVKKSRTISFSETLQHAGITPTWIGARNLYTYLCESSSQRALKAEDLQTFYKNSPVFRDVVDRMMFGLAKTDIEGLRARIPELKSSMFLDDLEQEYRYCARLALEAVTGKSVAEKDVARNTAPLSDLRARILEQLPHLEPAMTAKDNYIGAIQEIKSKWCNKPEDIEQERQRSLCHAASDTVHHSRFLAADDPAYGKLVGKPLPEKSVAAASR